jgi:hypothetical protein
MVEPPFGRWRWRPAGQMQCSDEADAAAVFVRKNDGFQVQPRIYSNCVNGLVKPQSIFSGE